MRIWTMGYFPFIMGGSTKQPIACDIKESGKRHSLGKGLYGYLLMSPGGKNVVAESETGALVGSSIAAVRADVKGASKKVMAEQIAESRIKSAHPFRLLSEKEFWRRYDKSDWDFEAAVSHD